MLLDIAMQVIKFLLKNMQNNLIKLKGVPEQARGI